ncbi:MAG TPA: glycosyltransferase family 4 protein [Methanocorpusculum sp.]|nr:glycosyltransferase family 4 protein [Methanocorpusculum sp.]
MKILRVAPDLYPYVVGGFGIHIADISHDQAAAGHNVTVYTCIEDKPDGVVSSENPRVYNIGRGLVLFGNSLCFNVYHLLKKHAPEYDIVHTHSHLFFSSLMCALYKRLHKKSMILAITNHGLISQNVPEWFQSLYNRVFGKFIFSSADAVISYTAEEAKVIENWGVNPEKIHIIHNGIKVERFLQQCSDIQRKKQIIWVGRFVIGKGVHELAEGFAAFSKKYPKYSLLMIGKGPEKDAVVQKIEDLGVSDKITILDFVPNDKMQAMYEESEVFLLPSYAEGVPKTMLEAMVCGLPVITTALPQILDIVDGCGFIVPVKDAGAIADALSEMVADSDQMRRFGEASRKKVLENYDWGDSVEKTTELFEELIKKK